MHCVYNFDWENNIHKECKEPVAVFGIFFGGGGSTEIEAANDTIARYK